MNANLDDAKRIALTNKLLDITLKLQEIIDELAFDDDNQTPDEKNNIKMVAIYNAEIYFAKLDKPKSPRYRNDVESWSVQIRTKSRVVMKDWRKKGLRVFSKISRHDDEEYYFSNIRRHAVRSNGIPNEPVIVVDHNSNPLDTTIIGNGSIGNIQIEMHNCHEEHKSLVAVQITKLIPYERKVDFPEVKLIF
jgi:hypothetical protein